jgi:hypothetical protein
MREDQMLKNLWVLLGLFVIGSLMLAATGADPNQVNLGYQVGLTMVTSAVFLFFERLLSGKPDSELVAEISKLRASIDKLKEDMNT